jgi:hypothetical protein
VKFDIDAVLKDMAEAAKDATKGYAVDTKDYASRILKKEKDALTELAMAKIAGQIDDATFEREVEREKKVVETELLTIEIMTKAHAQKAVNAAMDVFAKAVKAAITAVV